jgi:hypothetical protein
MGTSVVTLAAQIESLRRSIMGHVGAVCTQYATHPAVQQFVRDWRAQRDAERGSSARPVGARGGARSPRPTPQMSETGREESVSGSLRVAEEGAAEGVRQLGLLVARLLEYSSATPSQGARLARAESAWRTAADERDELRRRLAQREDHGRGRDKVDVQRLRLELEDAARALEAERAEKIALQRRLSGLEMVHEKARVLQRSLRTSSEQARPDFFCDFLPLVLIFGQAGPVQLRREDCRWSCHLFVSRKHPVVPRKTS